MEQLIKERKSALLSLKAYESIEQEAKAQQEWLKKKIQEFDKQIDAMVKAKEELKWN